MENHIINNDDLINTYDEPRSQIDDNETDNDSDTNTDNESDNETNNG